MTGHDVETSLQATAERAVAAGAEFTSCTKVPTDTLKEIVNLRRLNQHQVQPLFPTGTQTPK